MILTIVIFEDAIVILLALLGYYCNTLFTLKGGLLPVLSMDPDLTLDVVTYCFNSFSLFSSSCLRLNADLL